MIAAVEPQVGNLITFKNMKGDNATGKIIKRMGTRLRIEANGKEVYHF